MNEPRSSERLQSESNFPTTPVVVVSKHLPIYAHRNADGAFVSTPATGQLTRTVGPVLQHRGGAWVGWHGLSTPVSDLELETAPVDFPLAGVSSMPRTSPRFPMASVTVRSGHSCTTMSAAPCSNARNGTPTAT